MVRVRRVGVCLIRRRVQFLVCVTCDRKVAIRWVFGFTVSSLANMCTSALVGNIALHGVQSNSIHRCSRSW